MAFRWLPLDQANIKRIEALKKKMGRTNADADLDLALEEFARAQLQILRIREVQTRTLVALQKVMGGDELKALRRLASLDRYERYALTQRGRGRT